MSFWKITTDNKPDKISATNLKNEHILEKHLEDWIEDSTDILVSKLNRKFKTNRTRRFAITNVIEWANNN